MSKNILFTIIITLFSIALNATHLDVRIFYGQKITNMELGIVAGNYQLFTGDSSEKSFLKGENIQISVSGDSIVVKFPNKQAKKYKTIKIVGGSFINSVFINPAQKEIPKHIYDDDIYISAFNKELSVINHVELEHYVAGVVQGESGSCSDQIEYFFVQSIISRTYALVNYLKHSDEGFNLCDGVHCQVYNGRCRNADITRAVANTGGDVIVDKNYRMISAAFHSNCGGQTVNSEDIWTIPTDYLKSVKDSFCTNESNAQWNYKVSLAVFNKFLLKNGAVAIQSHLKDSTTVFVQKDRKVTGPGNIPLKEFRNYFSLRSTYFDVQLNGDSILFLGRGFGHGVGLCQQGAINMIKMGYDYKDVIKYYYTNVEIIHYTELKYNFMP